MGAGGVIIILKSIKQTLAQQYTSTASVRVWHSLLLVFGLGVALGAWVF